MTDREIELKLQAAFSKTIPAFPEAVLDQCSEQKGTVTDMKTDRHLSKALKIALIAATLILILAATVTAINLSNLIDPDSAIHQAINYVVKSETDSELKDKLSEAHLLGLVYDENLGTGEADLGLKDGRIVYNISYKTCGYAYEVVMDAKTGVIYSVNRDTDENWEEMLPELKKKSDEQIAALKEEQAKQEEEMRKEIAEAPDYSLLRSRFEEHFGITLNAAHIDVDGDPETRTAVCSMTVDGYIYTATLEYDTGKVLDESVTEDPKFEEERVRHEKINGVISLDEADEIAKAVVLEKYPEVTQGKFVNTNVTSIMETETPGKYKIVLNFYYYDDVNTDTKYVQADMLYTVRLNAEDGSVLEIVRRYGLEAIREKALEYSGMDEYNSTDANGNGECTFENEKLGKGVKVVIDPETLELISREEYEITQSDKDDYVPNDNLSNDAPDGLISEAAAATVALENTGVSERLVQGLKAELEGDVYKVSFKFGLKDFPATRDLRLNTYEIDAKTGEVLSADAITTDDYISEEEAIECARALTVEWGELTEEEASELTATKISLDSNLMGYHQYEIALQKDGDATIYRFQIDPLSGQDLIHR